MKRAFIVSLIVILAAFAASAWLYPRLPEQIASHWNIHGEVDGYLPKFWGAFLMPFMMLASALLLLIFPRIDPLKANVEKFKEYYYGFIVVLLIFFLFIHLQVTLWSVGLKVNPARTLPVGMGILFFSAGILCGKARQNWFIGVRTPWTLANEKVWEKTHRVAGKLFKISGVLAVLGVFFGEWSFYFVIIPVIFSAIFPLVFSYIAYKKEMAGK